MLVSVFHLLSGSAVDAWGRDWLSESPSHQPLPHLPKVKGERILALPAPLPTGSTGLGQAACSWPRYTVCKASFQAPHSILCTSGGLEGEGWVTNVATSGQFYFRELLFLREREKKKKNVKERKWVMEEKAISNTGKSVSRGGSSCET